MLTHVGSEGIGSSLIDIDQKENLLKVRNMKKQGKYGKSLVSEIRLLIEIDRWKVDAYTKPNPCSYR